MAPGSTAFVRRHFYETVEQRAISRQLSPVPYQAPQRERVSLVVRGSVLLQSTGDVLKADASWKRKIKGNNLESVPQLLWLLEPKIVFAHAKANFRGQTTESQYCQGMFLEGFHKGGGRAHGVYEGTYWDLLGNLNELMQALSQMAIGPAVLEEPELVLPPAPILPAWEAFKPVLQPLPPLPQLLEVPVCLPAFKPPKIAAVEYEAPDLQPLPPLLDDTDEGIPALVVPEGLKPRGLGVPPTELVFDAPLPPNIPLQPAAPAYDKPQHGADWTGLKPHHEPEPVLKTETDLPVTEWQHPPSNLPHPPSAQELMRRSGDSAASLTRTIGGMALAGTHAAISDDISSADVAGHTPTTTTNSRITAGSGANSPYADSNAAMYANKGQLLSPERSGDIDSDNDNSYDLPGTENRLQHDSTSAALDAPETAPAEGQATQLGSGSLVNPFTNTSLSEAATATGQREIRSGRPLSAAGSRGSDSSASSFSFVSRPNLGGSALYAGDTSSEDANMSPHSIAAFRPDTATRPQVGPAVFAASADRAAAGQANESEQGMSSGQVLRSGHAGYQSSSNMSAGGLPGLPPRPVQGPQPEFVSPFQEALPSREPLSFHPLPTFQCDKFQSPSFAPPCAPRPIGFLQGYAPLLLLDVSGTMHPGKGGRFFDMKACAKELLQPGGEIAAVAGSFDVIAFSTAPISWGACYEGHLQLLEGASKPLLGRQNGRRPFRPNSASTGCTRVQRTQAPKLLPAEPALLHEAARWVEAWQEPSGHTNYEAALQLAERYLESDCCYIFSDGLADFAVVLLERVRTRVMAGEALPVIHTVGFFAEEQRSGPGERFLRHLSALTGGTFQEYRPDLWRVWHNGAWADYDLAQETTVVRAERLWSEAALQAQRRNNARLGLEESFSDLMSRLPRLHAERVAKEALAHEAQVAILRAAHEAECDIVRKMNDNIQRRADEEYGRATQPLQDRNAAAMDAAQQQHQIALAQWQKAYELAVLEWEALRDALLAQQQKASKTGPMQLAGHATAVPSSAPFTTQQQLLGNPQARATASPQLGISPSAIPQSPSASLSTAMQQHTRQRQRGPAKRAVSFAAHNEDQAQPAPAEESLHSASAYGSPELPQQSRGVQQQPGLVPNDASTAALQPGQLLSVGSNAAGESTNLAFDAANADDPGEGLRALEPDMHTAVADRPDRAATLVHHDLGDDQDAQQAAEAQRAQQADNHMHQSPPIGLAPAQPPSHKPLRRQEAGRGQSVYAAKDYTPLEKYEAALAKAYAASFVAGALLQHVLPAAANAVVSQQHKAALAAVQCRNAEMKQLHLEEVKVERAAWQKHEEDIHQWKADKAALEADYANELAVAKKTHLDKVVKAKKQWEKEQKVLQAEYNRRLAIEKAQHDILIDPIRQRNAARHAAANLRQEERRQVQLSNDQLVATADQLHQQRLYEAQAQLSTALAVARQQHAEVCAQLQREHTAAQQAALQEHSVQKAAIGKWNDQTTLEARGRYGAEVGRVQKAHALQCDGVKQKHAAVCQQVRTHNEAIWPQVSIAQAAQSELDRTKAFIDHIRICAEKMEIGVNYVPETPNLARVVEMKALTEALRKAFPELTPDQYPWPHRQKGGQVGYGWTNPPQLSTCASTAQQALDRIRQIAVPRFQFRSADHAEASRSKHQVTSEDCHEQDDSQTAAAHTSTSHSSFSYRPTTPALRPHSARPVHSGKDRNSRRPMSARKPDSNAMLGDIGKEVHAKHQHRAVRSTSPLSDRSTVVTPSPIMTPCSVLSRPSTAGAHRRTYQPARKAIDAADVNSCTQRHTIGNVFSLHH